MSDNDHDPSPSKATCRIITVASSLDQALTFINQIRSLSPKPFLTEDVISLEPASPGQDGTTVTRTIPWTISNKYYTADVHFHACSIQNFNVRESQNAPAVLFIWARGEPYRENVLRLAQNLRGEELEVSLAIRLRGLVDDEDEDDSEIDEFLSSKGFEFIDEAGRDRASMSGGERDEDFADNIPGLPRVIDALSTIMWPTMEARPRETPLRLKNSQNVQIYRERNLLDWAQRDDTSTFASIDDLVTQPIRGRSGKMQRELDALTRWLEDDTELAKNDPWRSAADSGAITSSPTALEGPSIHIESKFEDDFTVFVSAPAETNGDDISGRRGSDVVNGSFDASFQAEGDTLNVGSLYRSLGSVSDFGDGTDDEREPVTGPDIELEDDSIPSQEEIRATSVKIFGAPPPSDRTDGASLLPSQPQMVPPPGEARFPLDSDAEEEDPYDMAPFDLSRVLSALQGMKAEIASMGDESERRRAAAKVALGLVYGLEGRPDVENL